MFLQFLRKPEVFVNLDNVVSATFIDNYKDPEKPEVAETSVVAIYTPSGHGLTYHVGVHISNEDYIMLKRVIQENSVTLDQVGETIERDSAGDQTDPTPAE